MRPTPFFYDHFDEPTASAIERVLSKLEQAGAAIEDRTIEDIHLAASTQFVTLASEACQANWHLLNGAGDRIGEEVRIRLEIGQFIARWITSTRSACAASCVTT